MRDSIPQTDQPLVEALSARELEILALMAENRSNREIADQLVLSLNTVKWYARQIYGKLGVGEPAMKNARRLNVAEGRPGSDRLGWWVKSQAGDRGNLVSGTPR